MNSRSICFMICFYCLAAAAATAKKAVCLKISVNSYNAEAENGNTDTCKHHAFCEDDKKYTDEGDCPTDDCGN